jgi:UDP-N-acetylglucosamine 2-epimerase (non-hydrolysing)
MFLVVVGTRPEAIKLAPVIRELKDHGEVSVVCSGQHQELAPQFLKEFGIIPDYILDMESDSLAKLTSRGVEQFNVLFKHTTPSVVIVQGDTTTALTAALAAFYLRIPVAHVEAGLRTFSITPFPEEMNRRTISTLANYHFAPTFAAAENLRNESVLGEIHITGNTAVDAVQQLADSTPHHQFENKTLLLTLHRRENHVLIPRILNTLEEITHDYDVDILFPVHPNPDVQAAVKKALSPNSRITTVESATYTQFVQYMKGCYFILTDSGGIQEEAPALGVPVVVLRDSTERLEGLVRSTAILAGTSSESIYEVVSRLLTDTSLYNEMVEAENPYGDGTASKQIAKVLRGNFS